MGCGGTGREQGTAALFLFFLLSIINCFVLLVILKTIYQITFIENKKF